MNKIWECINIDEKKVEEISKIHGITNLISKILAKKNIISKEEIEKFLNPTRHDFYDPYLLPDMQKAVDRIEKAINNKEKIIIYGDYDVDGITSITVLKSFLEDIGVYTSYYIPNRLDEGYGLNKEAIKKIADEKNNLIITVDCGISSIEEVEYANSLGIDVIITDHHEVGEYLPNAIAVVDAKRKDNIYPCNYLAGVGVSFKLTQAIAKRLNIDEKEYLKYLDIVCIGTISDIVPLVDENRVIAKLGLKLVQVTKNEGLRALIEISGYKKVDSSCISFGISPRINACGRMGNATLALELFLCKDSKRAKQIAINLNEYNKQRQEIEKRMLNEALEKIEGNNKIAKNNVIILGSKNWHHGIIGIVSSKITDMYFKPSILICLEEGICRGSGRSIPGFDLFKALNECKEHIYKFGGHSMAIGISLKEEEFENFKKDFEEYTQNLNISDIIPIINVDDEIQLKDISIKEVEDLKLLEPFGEANQVPLFMIKNLRIEAIRALSDGKHLKLMLKDDSFIIDAIGFNLGFLADEYRIGEKIDVVGNLEINEFNETKKIQINLKDIRRAF